MTLVETRMSQWHKYSAHEDHPMYVVLPKGEKFDMLVHCSQEDAEAFADTHEGAWVVKTTEWSTKQGPRDEAPPPQALES